MRYDDLPQSDNIEDRRGDSGGGGGGGFPMGGRGGLGIGTIVVLGIIGYALGIDPRLLIGGAEMLFRRRPVSSSAEPALRQDRRAERRHGQVRRADPRLAPTCSGSRSSSRPGSAIARRHW